MAPSPSLPVGPGELVDLLARWAGRTDWVEWVELAGSLGRGAGDERSDVDAAAGVVGDDRFDAVAGAVREFAPTAAVLRQSFGSNAAHLVIIYRDGRQLSLVVMPAASRSGLPPEAIALVDKTDRLAVALDRSAWDPDAAQRREWTFLACISAHDAIRHAERRRTWRALRSLEEARGLYLRLVAAQEHVIFPQFGAVSLENADRPVPPRPAETLVSTPELGDIRAATGKLLTLLHPFIAEHGLYDLAAALDRHTRP